MNIKKRRFLTVRGKIDSSQSAFQLVANDSENEHFIPRASKSDLGKCLKKDHFYISDTNTSVNSKHGELRQISLYVHPLSFIKQNETSVIQMQWNWARVTDMQHSKKENLVVNRQWTHLAMKTLLNQGKDERNNSLFCNSFCHYKQKLDRFLFL